MVSLPLVGARHPLGSVAYQLQGGEVDGDGAPLQVPRSPHPEQLVPKNETLVTLTY